MTEEPDWKLEAEKIDVHGADARDWADALFAAYALGKRHATEWRPTHKHLKSGHVYRVIVRAEIESDLRPCVVYDDKAGRTWVRPAAEFDDGRFQPLPAPPEAT
ncbi:hypothetical protein UFOVP1619_7 [uncultured Caudovirales phage]|uniref:DUF1653 domain-containing protein n=1 Tax=uncultured Caudovirales phage TaxID=2100421 RepID=A0A6J5SWS8_9CAUD|nr:hypothetical protein UFOVP1619_7 [uncultured Caudovirales phage]